MIRSLAEYTKGLKPLDKQKVIDKLMDIWLQGNLQAHNFIPAAYWQANYREVEQVYLPQSETYLWLENTEIAGFISIAGQDYIGGLFVAAEEQGKGIGGQLLAHCQERYPRLRLQVYALNQRAATFYRRHGFTQAAKQTDGATGQAEFVLGWPAASLEKAADYGTMKPE